MKLANATWPEIEALDRNVVVLIPTGSLEQHGAHLPLFTDSILGTAFAEAVESRLPDDVLLVPTLWLGASHHHLAFAGSLSNSFEGYDAALTETVRCMIGHGFSKFYILNAHGGNQSPNDVAVRKIKAEHPSVQIGHGGYFEFLPTTYGSCLEGRLDHIRHACEAETSLMLHVAPYLVRLDRAVSDGLEPSHAIPGMVWHFNESTQNGSTGDPQLATVEKGATIFNAALEPLVEAMQGLRQGIVLAEK